MAPLRNPRGALALKVALGLVGFVVSVLLLSTVFFRWNLGGEGPLLTPRFELGEFFSQLPHHLPWLLVFCCLSGSVIPFRALQWQRTLPKPVPFKERYHVVALGAFAHNAVPGKLGEGFRAFLLARSQKLPFVLVLGSVAVGKLLEFAALMALVALSALGPLRVHSPELGQAVRVASFVCLGLVALVLVLAHGSGPMAAKLLRRQDRFPRLRTFLEHVRDGLGTARSWKGLFLALLFSVPPIAANALAYGIALEGIGVEDGLFAGAIVLAAISLGQSTPGIPITMGVYYFVTSFAARAYGASAESAAAFATMTHLATVGTQVSVGAISLWKRKIRWSDLKREKSRAAEETAREVKPHAHPPSPATTLP